MKKKRLDVALFEKGLAESREKAKALIMEGAVFIGGVKCDKPGMQVSETADITLKDTGCPYVSRGGYKLEKALDVFDIDPKDYIAMDIGASTGGFTDCLLQRGARKVYSIDVGTNQLAYKLRTDDRVVVYEKSNFRYFPPENVTDKIDIAVMDVSFISITKLTENLKNFTEDRTDFVFLIKPQFESGRDEVGKNGVITDRAVHIKTLHTVIGELDRQGYYLRALDYSPIKGPKGNIEYISRFSFLEEFKAGNTDEMIKETVEKAYAELK
ncbi:MAG: TlyA family RNA methyltransferase [Eubacteriaceae bacterium]|nr:TlyA family RNA methyltransferase [Eubacteriaceae bacterium]